MREKILIPLMGEEIAPRFDLSTEVLILSSTEDLNDYEEKILVLPQSSAEDLCHLVLTEGIQLVICGGIEEEYFHYLSWKKIKVYDSVIGSWKAAIEKLRTGTLAAGTILTNSV